MRYSILPRRKFPQIQICVRVGGGSNKKSGHFFGGVFYRQKNAKIIVFPNSRKNPGIDAFEERARKGRAEKFAQAKFLKQCPRTNVVNTVNPACFGWRCFSEIHRINETCTTSPI